MMARVFSSKTFWILLALGLFLYWRFRKQIDHAILAQRTGHAAAQEAAGVNGYTTYNTSLYSPPPWFPSLKFWKANPYVPTPPAGAQAQVYSQSK